MDDLAQRHEPGVGAAAGVASAGLRPVSCSIAVFEYLLDGPLTGLTLPAVEVGAVVAEGQLDVPHGRQRSPLRGQEPAHGQDRARASSSSSAIWTALVAAPLRRLSLTHQKRRALGRLRSWRMRPTKTSSVPAAAAARG